MACAKHIVRNAKASRSEKAAPGSRKVWKKRLAVGLAAGAGAALGGYGLYRMLRKRRGQGEGSRGLGGGWPKGLPPFIRPKMKNTGKHVDWTAAARARGPFRPTWQGRPRGHGRIQAFNSPFNFKTKGNPFGGGTGGLSN